LCLVRDADPPLVASTGGGRVPSVPALAAGAATAARLRGCCQARGACELDAVWVCV